MIRNGSVGGVERTRANYLQIAVRMAFSFGVVMNKATLDRLCMGTGLYFSGTDVQE